MLAAPLPTSDGEPEDPYQWLEDVSAAKSLAWVKERNTESTNELTRSAGFQALDRRILEILDSEDRIPTVQKLARHYYNFWRDRKNPRGLWRRTTFDEYRKAKPAWEVVLDLDLLGKEEKENWVWHGAQALKPDYERALDLRFRGVAPRRERGPGIRPGWQDVRERWSHPSPRSQEAQVRPRCAIATASFVGSDFGSWFG